MTQGVDLLDARIIALFTEQPTIGVLGASRALGVARGTVQARLERLQSRGVIASLAPTIDPGALGYPVTAFCSLQIRQTAGQSPVVAHLSSIPEVIEAYTITGAFDLFVIVVARNNSDLQRVIDAIVEHDHIERASTQIALSTHIESRTLPLVQASALPTHD
ncbi:Regulatory protein AsnC [Austwickia sp. TVS 96-490-7B]|uniref:Lrp/AsnC family transcriptional regulator n=1 Tax=Austwickia sp. TVS 96-490-7B TaxID=2830843 RepID=UPI001C5A1BF0|nr:Lrp/AsnC family transcriptional regulator [Austwickia sp. TVS 96-490-7B]MBW3086563.1 Regulatory protein AsnC [Austwickia sp. TVS 96-490-7B]